jgi:hypothetical protein
MTQLDPRSQATSTPQTPSAGGQPVKEGPPFDWRVSVGMAIGLVVLFGLLFGLRTFGIFPPRPAEDPEIAAVRATLAALSTQQPAPAAQPILAPTSAAPTVATVAQAPTTVPTPAPAQQPATQTQVVSTVGEQFETAPTPVATATSNQTVPTVATTPAITVPTESAAATSRNAPSAQPTPVAVNLPADLANAILQGYTNYWTVRVNALSDPYDTSINLETVMGGTELETARQTIAHFRDIGETGVSNVHHQIWITSASPEQAVIVDRYTAQGQRVVVDPTTHVPLHGDQVIEDESYADRFLLQYVDGVWKVVAEEPE